MPRAACCTVGRYVGGIQSRSAICSFRLRASPPCDGSSATPREASTTTRTLRRPSLSLMTTPSAKTWSGRPRDRNEGKRRCASSPSNQMTGVLQTRKLRLDIAGRIANRRVVPSPRGNDGRALRQRLKPAAK